MDQEMLERARAVKDRVEDDLLARPNVIGVGVGMRHRGGALINEVCLVVSVRRKRPPAELDEDEMLPEHIDGVPVDVLEVYDVEAGSGPLPSD